VAIERAIVAAYPRTEIELALRESYSVREMDAAEAKLLAFEAELSHAREGMARDGNAPAPEPEAMQLGVRTTGDRVWHFRLAWAMRQWRRRHGPRSGARPTPAGLSNVPTAVTITQAGVARVAASGPPRPASVSAGRTMAGAAPDPVADLRQREQQLIELLRALPPSDLTACPRPPGAVKRP
jgi:hypothetical protein